MAAPEHIEQLRVRLIGYREVDGGEPVRRVDVIDVRELVSLLTLTPADARTLAVQLAEVADWAEPERAAEPGS